MNLDFVLSAVDGKLLSRQQELFDSVATDTRLNMDNALFIALKGDAFDAHQFLGKALEQGAAGLMIHDEPQNLAELAARATIIKVPDTLKALQDLAHAARLENRATVIGIAGSNGKTTSKEFTAAVIGEFRDVHYSKGSFNNHWGVPFTLLAQDENAEVAVVEMGMNHKDELALITRIAEPDVAVCTYVGVEHIEHFGTLEKIAEAESEIYDHSPGAACRIYNLDNIFTRQMYEAGKKKFPKAKFLTFSTDSAADVQLQVQHQTMESMRVVGKIAGLSGVADVAVFGAHNVVNLMVAASAALAVGLLPEQIWAALSQCRTTWGRNQMLKTKSGALILFDGYNSNPDSMKALVKNMNLVQVEGRRLGVFAEMRELGDLAAELHEQTGAAVGATSLDEVWFYGPHHEDFARGLRLAKFRGQVRSSVDFDSGIAQALAGGLRAGDVALVKGSRGMQLERFVRLTDPLDFHEKT